MTSENEKAINILCQMVEAEIQIQTYKNGIRKEQHAMANLNSHLIQNPTVPIEETILIVVGGQLWEISPSNDGYCPIVKRSILYRVEDNMIIEP